MKNLDDIQFSQEEECIFCPQQQNNEPSDLFEMMNQALAAKHLSQSNNHLILPIDIILKLQEPTTSLELQDYITYKELTYVDQIEQNLKRQYKINEFDGKIKMLSEYYKFHKDIPHIVQKDIQKILTKYYDRKREHDYKCIKKKLKQEEGVSITSMEQSGTENSETVEQKSRYSTLLNQLNVFERKEDPLMSDSNLLEEICKQIGEALPKNKKFDHDFQDYDLKGNYYEPDKNFENYLKKIQLRKNHKVIKVSQVAQQLKKRAKDVYDQRQRQNYFNFKKKQRFEDHQTIKHENDTKIRSRRPQKERSQRAQDKKRFVYNTNIKIQIQNALFYPGEHHQRAQFGSGPRQNNFNTAQKISKSKKSLVDRVSALRQDRYRTPINKIYQPQQTDASSKYKRKNNSTNKRQRLRTKQSKDLKQYFHERQRDKQAPFPKRAMSSHNFRRPTADNNYEHFKDKHINNGTISVAKLKLQNQKSDVRYRGSSIRRGSSQQSLKRRSITLTQNKQSLQKIPISKYSSSQIKQSNIKGITIKDLLTKKLNIYQR